MAGVINYSSMTISALPDPTLHPGFYDGVSIKRLAAWTIDTVLCFLMTLLITMTPLFINVVLVAASLLMWPLTFMVVSFLYRTVTISRKSATWGMRFFNIELRNRAAERLDSSEAAIHTAVFLGASLFVLPQLMSAVLMLLSDRGHGLHDIVAGTTMINKPSSY